jgi:hypothetical protein
MQDLITRVALATGMSSGRAAYGTAILMTFIAREISPAAMEKIYAAVPGASDLVAAEGGGGSHGLLGGLTDMSSSSGVIGALSFMDSAGFSVVETQKVAAEIMDVLRDSVDADVLRAVHDCMPGLARA